MSSRYEGGALFLHCREGWELRPSSDNQLSTLFPALLLIPQRITLVLSKRIARGTVSQTDEAA
jgi:hypothetical protein